MANKLSYANIGSAGELPAGSPAPTDIIVGERANGTKYQAPVSELTGTTVLAYGGIKVGSDTALADSSADVFEVAAGAGVALTLDTVNKILSISAGVGAAALDDLTDVSVSSPVAGQVVRYNGLTFTNASLAQADISGLVTALAGKSDIGHLHSGIYALASHPHVYTDVSGLGSAALVDVPLSISQVSGLQAVLDGKSDTGHSHSISAILAGTPNRLIGRDGTGNTAEISAGANVTIAGGVISAATGIAGVAVQYNGTPLGTANTVNFTGAGQSVTYAGGTATIYIPGGGGSGGLPVGGSYGQVLQKNSGLDGDAIWATLPVIERRHVILDDTLAAFANQPNLILDGFAIVDEPTSQATRVSPIENGDAPIVVQGTADAPIGGTWQPILTGVAIACCEIAAPAGDTLTITGPDTSIGSATGRIIKRLRVTNSLAGVLTLTFDTSGTYGFEVGGDLVAPDLTLDAGQVREFVIVNDGGHWFYGSVAGAGGGGAVSSVFGRTGVVIAVSGDYTAAQVTETVAAKIMTGDERTKLAGIENAATADQTGAEIVAAINSSLGSTVWQGGGSGGSGGFYRAFNCGTITSPQTTATKDQWGLTFATPLTFGAIDMGTILAPANIGIDLGVI